MIRFADFFLAAVAAFVVAAAPPPALAERDVMQCMERCLRHEGRDARDTCKLRCADVPAVTGPTPGVPARATAWPATRRASAIAAATATAAGRARTR